MSKPFIPSSFNHLLIDKMNTFTKAERLSSKVVIDDLFNNGKSFYAHPFKVCWLENVESITSVQVLISVPKRIYKRAVDRNRVKRIIRECYRKNKEILQKISPDNKIALMLIYTSKTILEYQEVETKLIVALNRLITNINNDSAILND